MQIFLLFFSVFSLFSIIFSVPVQNSVNGDAQLECNSSTIKVIFRTEHPFSGNVFIKDYSSEPSCISRGSGRQVSAVLEIEIGLCGTVRQRTLNPRGTEVRTTVTISFHPYFITKVDRTYHIVCIYKEENVTLANNVSVKDITTVSIGRNATMPICSYEILEGGPNGNMVRFSTIGQQVYHRWKCESENEDALCMLVHTCSADDGKGDRAFLIDSNGCSIDRFLLSDIEYPQDLLAGQEAHVYKFADRDALFFQCQISITVRITGEECFRPICGVPEGEGSPGGKVRPYGLSKTAVSKRSVPIENVVDVRTRLSVVGPPLGPSQVEQTCLLFSHLSTTCVLIYLLIIISTFVVASL